jgi:hypothetical protein
MARRSAHGRTRRWRGSCRAASALWRLFFRLLPPTLGDHPWTWTQRTLPPIWLPFMSPSVPGIGSRMWMICVIRAFGWLTGTRHAGMSACYTPLRNKAPRAAGAGLRATPQNSSIAGG